MHLDTAEELVRPGVANGAVMPEGDQAAHSHFPSCGRKVEIQHVARRRPEGLGIIFGTSSSLSKLGVDEPMSAVEALELELNNQKRRSTLRPATPQGEQQTVVADLQLLYHHC